MNKKLIVKNEFEKIVYCVLLDDDIKGAEFSRP